MQVAHVPERPIALKRQEAVLVSRRAGCAGKRVAANGGRRASAARSAVTALDARCSGRVRRHNAVLSRRCEEAVGQAELNWRQGESHCAGRAGSRKSRSAVRALNLIASRLCLYSGGVGIGRGRGCAA